MRKLVMLMAAMVAAVCAMAQGNFYVVMKDGSAEKFPVDKVDSLTFENIEADKVLGMGDLMKVVDGLKSEVDSLKGENSALKEANKSMMESNIKSHILGDWKAVKIVYASDGKETVSDATLNITENTYDSYKYNINGDTLTYVRFKAGNTFYSNYTIDKLTIDSLVMTQILDDGTRYVTYHQVRVNEAQEALEAKVASLESNLKSYVESYVGNFYRNTIKFVYDSKIDSLDRALTKKMSSDLDALDKTINSRIDIIQDLAAEEISGHSYVDLGLESGTLWATCNVDATKREEYGKRYSFARIEDATDSWGADWSMPTQAQFEELAKLKHEITVVNGVKGMKFIGNNGNTVFFPFAGSKTTSVAGEGKYGHYWSSTKKEDSVNLAYELYVRDFDDDYANVNVTSANTGNQLSVRLVVKK